MIWVDIDNVGVLYDVESTRQYFPATRPSWPGLRTPVRLRSGSGETNARVTIEIASDPDLLSVIHVPPLAATATVYAGSQAEFTGSVTSVRTGETISMRIER